MFNSIFTEAVEQHCHRFLWRDLETDKEPDTHIILRVSMGDRLAGAISSEALYKTATLFEEQFPSVAEVLRHSPDVDDIVDSASSFEAAVSLAKETDTMLSKAGLRVKSLQFSTEATSRQDVSQQPLESGNQPVVRVLGLLCNPKEDSIHINSKVNFSKEKRSIHLRRCECRTNSHCNPVDLDKNDGLGTGEDL